VTKGIHIFMFCEDHKKRAESRVSSCTHGSRWRESIGIAASPLKKQIWKVYAILPSRHMRIRLKPCSFSHHGGCHCRLTFVNKSITSQRPIYHLFDDYSLSEHQGIATLSTDLAHCVQTYWCAALHVILYAYRLDAKLPLAKTWL
jgi:hypothetical protein